MPLSLWTPLPAPVVPWLPLSPHRVPRIPRPRVPRLQRGLRGATAAAAVSATWSLAQRRGAQGGEALLQALQRNGFVTVELSGAEEKVLGEALEDFAQQRSFRYPPVPGDLEEVERVEDVNPVMTTSFAQSFDLLYGVACSAALLMQGQSVPKQLKPCDGEGMPFSRGGPWHFSSSFFNIFNYDHGCLNAHRDRGVLTVVYGAPSDREDASRLWVRHADGTWWAPAPGQLLLWAGEGFQHAEPVEHCVRMRPDGDYVEHSHSRRDPEAPATGNRRSVALILDE